MVVECVGIPADRIAAFYRSPVVRERLQEYCGGHPMTATAIAGYGGTRRLRLPEGGPVPVPRELWPRLLAEGADVCRSLGDARGTLLLLDVDYANREDPAEPYRDPEACFPRIEPIYRAARDVLAHYGIQAVALMTGRGYHFTALVPSATPLHRELRRLGARARPESDATAEAHEGAGRLLEFLAHEVLRRVATVAETPVTLADLPPPGGGPFVCLDLSAYGDPLKERYARCAFSSNQKAGASGAPVDHAFSINLPRGDFDLEELLVAREDPGAAVELAASVPGRIPETSAAERLVHDYEASPLGRFHRDFDGGPQIAPEAWPWTYDSLDTNLLPGCVARPLDDPNPALLQPAFLRTVALALWAIGWHPRSVAGLVRSRFERDHRWGDQWLRFDPAQRAEFYVRLFAGAVVAGLDAPADFTCESQAGRQLCDSPRCSATQRALFEALRGPLMDKR